MGFKTRILTAIKEPEKVKSFFKRKSDKFHRRKYVNELLLLIKRKKFGGVVSYLISGISGFDIYNNYLKFRVSREGNITLVPVKDFKMFIDLNDLGLSKQLYLYGTREEGPATVFENELEKLSQEVESNLIIDIGANIGFYSIIEANIINNGIILAIEPNKANTELLKKNIKYNNINDIVHIYQCAIGSESGEARLKLSNHSNLHRIENDDEFSANDDSNSEIVPIQTLDEFVKENDYNINNVNVLRMDIEGKEVDALRGMNELLNSDGPILLYIEVHNHLISEDEAAELSQRLSDAGFKIKAVEWGTITNSPFSLSYDIEEWDDLKDISGAYSLIAKKSKSYPDVP